MLYAHQKIQSVALLVLLLSIFSDVSRSQSGRRASKLPGPPPAAIEAPNANSASSTGPAQQKIHLLVARQTTRKHLQTEDAVFASFVKRLNEYANIEGVSIGDMKQSQAAARAKTETTDSVVIVTFDIDSFAGGTIILNSQDLEIEYFLFAPRSGKKQTQGKVYFQGVGSGRLRKSNWPNGTPVKMTPEDAGIEAAESLYQWLLFSAATKKPTQ
ncbi:MAG TPA: hypothetical protein VN951_08600 [Pyrinomonadaceae bacterium]|nr:hypothetical protein [Pyrinomonadaceae bacterium]